MTNVLMQQLGCINDYDAGERVAICEGAVAEIERLRGPGNPTQAALDAATKPLHVEIERLQPFEKASLHVQGGGDLAGMIVQRDHWLEVARKKDAEIEQLTLENQRLQALFDGAFT